MMQYLLFVLVAPLSASAQTADPPSVSKSIMTASGLPDPATVNVPDVTPSGDSKVRKEGYKFYYFQSPSVSFAEAVQDLQECRGHLVTAGGVQVPGFIPWDEAHQRRTQRSSSPYGLVGAGLSAIIVPKMERGARSNKMRRCMGTRGYVRYPIPEAVWETLNDGDEEALVFMQAKLASSPAPQDEVVSE